MDVVAGKWPAELNRCVVCIGTQKAATSFLFTQMAKHPDICVPSIKEVHFWDTLDGVEPRRFQRRALRTLRAGFMMGNIMSADGRAQLLEQSVLTRARFLRRRGIEAYRRYLLSNYATEPVLFEASPGYSLVSADTFRLMAASMVDLRIILMMRDPVDRLWSAVKYIFRKKLEQGRASRKDVLDFFLGRVRDPESLGFRHSDYERTLAEIDAAGLADKLSVLFQESLAAGSEQDALTRAVGFEVSLNHQKKVNTHSQHFEGEDALFIEAREAFSAVYLAVRERYGSRVPDCWRA
ncbi:MAG: sulfotransferase [Pseudomonadota bacterium]